MLNNSEATLSLTLDEVERLSVQCLAAHGASPLQAEAVARSIRDAEAEGSRLIGLGYLPWYCGHLKAGKIDGQAEPVKRRTAPGMILVNAADGFAHPAYEAAEESLIDAAQTQGIALLGITNAYACGILGYFTGRLARRGLIALMFANTSAAMAPWGGSKPFFGTNPWSLGVPRSGEPLIIDCSASATAFVNLSSAAAEGRPIPADWALDSEGRPTTDAAEGKRGSIAPSGGHKGAALALMVEVLAAGLTGANWSHAASSLSNDVGGPPRLGQTIIAIRADGLGAAGLPQRIDGLLAEMGLEPGVRVPGDRRHTNRQHNTTYGVPVDAKLMKQLRERGATD